MKLALSAVLVVPSLVFAADDIVRANSYDDAWQSTWEARVRAVHGVKTGGRVIHVGDSITHANPYSQWPRNGAGKTTDDISVITWSHGADAYTASPGNPDDLNGFGLAAVDTSGRRGITASGGMDCVEFLSGDGNNGVAMPDIADQAAARAALGDGTTYDGNLRASTLASAYRDAEVVILMLGTNDVSSGRAATAVKADLAAMVTVFEARSIAVVLSTIPPHIGNETFGNQVSAAIRQLAQERELPLIDVDAEFRARRPTDWNGTLLNAGDVHPTANGAGYGSASDPYAGGGDPATHTTGAAAANVGYLLRSWLTIQKLKEVKAALDGGSGTTGTGTTGTAGTGTTGTTGTSGTGTTGTSGSSGTGTTGTGSSSSGTGDVGCGKGSSFGVIGAAGVALALLLRRPRH